MRWRAVLLVVPLLGSPLLAANPPAQKVVSQDRAVHRNRIAEAEMVRAATASAVSALYDQIADLPLAAGMTVGRYVRTMDQQEEFTMALHRADQIGAPRWIDTRTCQVQLELSKEAVKRDLMRIAAAYPKASPLNPTQIDRAIGLWTRRRFMATGTSAAPRDVVALRPSANISESWVGVSDAARRKALAAASADAASRAMSSVSPILLSNRKTIGDSFAIPEVGQAVRNWLAQRPVTQVAFKDDMQVVVVLGVNDRDYFSVVRDALQRQNAMPVPKSPEDWHRIERDFSSRFTTPVGQARAGEAQAVVRAAPVIKLPAESPEWTDKQIEVKGEAKGAGPRLKTLLAAETDARSDLERRIGALRLDKIHTMAEAAKLDQRVADAMGRAVKYARISKTEYHPDGQVVVRMYADLKSFWMDLRQALPTE